MIPEDTMDDLRRLMNNGKPRAGWDSATIPCSYLFALAEQAGDHKLYDEQEKFLRDNGWAYDIYFDAWTKRESA